MTALISTAVLILCIQPFLAVTAPVDAKVLVVEGWAEDYALDAAIRELDQHDYQHVYVTGTPIERGAPLSEYKTYAALGAAALNRLGVPTNRLQAVPAPQVQRDRTYASALALRDWLAAHHQLPTSLNLLTVGPHARRSRLLYEKAFGDECKIGVIAVEDQSYNPRRWWVYSQGVRSIVGETVGYLYARLLFRVSADRRVPDKSESHPAGPSS